MIPREELTRWLGDPGAQDASTRHVEIVTKRLKALRLFTRLRGDLDALPRRTAPSILGCAGEAMEDEDGLREIFSCLIEAAAADPFFRPALRNVSSELHSGLLLFDTPDLTIFAAVIPVEALAAKRLGRRGGRSIIFSGQHGIHRFVRSGGAVLSLWEAPLIEAGFSAGDGGRCRLVERRRIADGDVVTLERTQADLRHRSRHGRSRLSPGGHQRRPRTADGGV